MRITINNATGEYHFDCDEVEAKDIERQLDLAARYGEPVMLPSNGGYLWMSADLACQSTVRFSSHHG